MSAGKIALVIVLATVYLPGGVAVAEPGSADAYCRQEAADYGVQPEHMVEYVAGCIEAMGGAAAYVAPEEVIVDEGGLSPEVQTSRESE